MKHAKLFAACAISALALSTAANAADSDLLVFDWAGWEIDGLNAEYVAKHGQKPTYTFFGDDDEAFQKVSTGFRADVGHPCVASVSRYRDAGLIEPWDTARLTELANFGERFFESPIVKDDEGLWFIPLDYAYTAVAYNKDQVTDEEVASLDVFLNPKFANRIALSDSADDIWSLAFLAVGVTDLKDATPEKQEEAAAWLREAHKNVRAYWSDPAEMAQLMATGEVLVSWSWNDGVALLRQEGFPVGFQRDTKEGTGTFSCGYVNFKNAPGSEDKAYDFMNSVMAQASAKALVDAIGYAHSNDEGMKLVPAEELDAAFLGPLKPETKVIMQSPVSPEFREWMINEFEMIKSGF